jgi:hypothetical protein
VCVCVFGWVWRLVYHLVNIIHLNLKLEIHSLFIRDSLCMTWWKLHSRWHICSLLAVFLAFASNIAIKKREREKKLHERKNWMKIKLSDLIWLHIYFYLFLSFLCNIKHVRWILLKFEWSVRAKVSCYINWKKTFSLTFIIWKKIIMSLNVYDDANLFKEIYWLID